ncbi:hypothetical protein CDAR_408611 [Caerostris darwini]|uniref:Uncharacterized protein n=1 Tax=Caerostris darwini TaxID=1538125 RepID=A0AAV4MDH9_9ARAC|nr:hypothetical protein CDAR_408611 [Caerostris darwini]
MSSSSSIVDKRRNAAFYLRTTNIVYVFVLGEKLCGKSSLIRALATNEVEDSNLPSLAVFQSRESISKKWFLLRFCELTKKPIHMEEVKRTCQQQNTVLFLCFAIDDVYSLHAINLDCTTENEYWN